jgi:ABC-type phosphate transport system substrate-binding protein
MNRNRLLLLVLSLILTIVAANAGAATVKLVVNAGNTVPSMSKAKAADLFLKRVTRWDNGRAVTPVDLSEKSSIRAAFSKEVLGKEVAWVKSYWQKMIFSGRATPPAELSTDAQVLELVRTNADAIGYVSDTTAIPAGVKTLTVQN